MNDEQFKQLEAEVDAKLKCLTDNNTITLPLNFLSDITGLSFDMVESQIERIIARRGLTLNKMRDKDRSGKITRINFWKP
jgi:hypothetical protein